MKTPQKLALLGAGVSVLSLLIAYFFMERHLLLEPCPLCILDRFAVAVVGGGCLALAFCWREDRRGRGWAAWAASAFGLVAGLVFAGRHVWLQRRPAEEAGLCLPTEASGLLEVISRAFDANADCGAVSWEFAGLSIAEQTLLLFVALGGLLALLAAQMRRTAKP